MQVVEGRDQLPVGEVAGRPEEDELDGMGEVHGGVGSGSGNSWDVGRL